jgi:hypothetical protein
MKELVKRAKSFMTFDFPLQTGYISTQFANTHKKLQTENPGWSTMATRQILISNYWFTYVAGHFAVMALYEYVRIDITLLSEISI